MPEPFTDSAVPEIRPREFALIKTFAYETFGLDLRQGRERLVSARLGKHIRAGGFRSFEEYFRSVQNDRSGESIKVFIDALTTNHTSFLREREHFDFMVDTVLPEFVSRPSLQIWSAACSTGEEPYSILFSLLDAIGTSATPDVHITATDISSRVLATAQSATYSADRVQGLPTSWTTRYFDRSGPKAQSVYQVKQQYRSRITFRRFNLMHTIPQSRRYSVVFCRNVMIYFNKLTQAALVNRLAGCIQPGGFLFVGHAESLSGIDHPLQYVRPAIYRKPQ
jgi:chemotaxis protein methyltransferase CheR